MAVKLIRAYACAPEGHTVFRYAAGTVLHGMAAKLALADGAGHEIGVIEPLETKVTGPDETKKRGRPPKKDIRS